MLSVFLHSVVYAITVLLSQHKCVVRRDGGLLGEKKLLGVVYARLDDGKKLLLFIFLGLIVGLAVFMACLFVDCEAWSLAILLKGTTCSFYFTHQAIEKVE